MNDSFSINDRVFFSYGRKPYSGTVLEVDNEAKCATVEVDNPVRGMSKHQRVFLRDLIHTRA